MFIDVTDKTVGFLIYGPVKYNHCAGFLLVSSSETEARKDLVVV